MNGIRAKITKRLASKCKQLLSSIILNNEIARDKNYDLGVVDDCFKSRSSTINDNKIFERIVSAYNKAKIVQAKSGQAYQVSNEWLPIYDKFMNEIIDALLRSNTIKIQSIYNNFMREPCSVGLHGLPVDMFTCYFSGKISNRNKKIYLQDALHRYNLWKNTIGISHNIEELEAPNFGNPYGYFIDGHFIRTGADYLHYYATTIGRLIRSNRHKVVIELGGGYGGMAYYLMRDNTRLTYIDFDLPENIALTSYYLLSCFTDKKIALYGEIDLTTSDIGSYDAILMPCFEIPKMKDNSANLIFNSYSLAEMSKETIEEYISHFNRISNKYLYHVNHNKISNVRADDFKIDNSKFELLYKIPALWNSARNVDMDEFEYLYKSTLDEL